MRQENLADKVPPDVLRFLCPEADSEAGCSSVRFTSHQRITIYLTSLNMSQAPGAITITQAPGASLTIKATQQASLLWES